MTFTIRERGTSTGILMAELHALETDVLTCRLQETSADADFEPMERDLRYLHQTIVTAS